MKQLLGILGDLKHKSPAVVLFVSFVTAIEEGTREVKEDRGKPMTSLRFFPLCFIEFVIVYYHQRIFQNGLSSDTNNS